MPDKAVNKVIYGNNVLMDITDTTAQASDVVQGKDFYGADGIKTSGTAVIPTKTSDLTNDSGFITGMTILSYGSSTWQDFLDAYNANKVVYCRASSNSNPASGSQTRLAFMAYVSNATNPTNVEFQYYRSMSSHSETQQGDEVYVYKLANTGTWTVTVRKASPNIVAGTGLSRSYSNDTVTLSLDGTIPTKTSDLTNDSGFITTEADPTVPSWAKASTKPSYTASEVGALPDDTDIPSKISDLTNDQVYDLGVKTENDGYILLEGSEAEDILAMWNRGMCALVVTVSGRTYVAFKEQVITFRGLPLYSFVGTWSGLNENGRPVSSKVALALSYFEYDPSYIMFALIPDVMSINGIGVDDNNEITLDASDVGALPDDTVIPSKTSDLTNDSGFITTETDPTVPSWAKASTKPSYTASEVGAVAASSVGAASGVVPLNASSKIDETYLPSYVDDVIEGYFYNGSFYKESSHTTVITGEAGKIYVDLTTDKTYRYGGSTFVEISSGTTVSVSRDLTTGTKVATITVNGTGSDIYAPTPPTKVSDLTNDSGFITGISSSDVTTALGYTPYNSTNPNSYVNATGAANAAPVQSVNNKTGAVSLTASDVGALPDTTVISTKTSDLVNDGSDGNSAYLETDETAYRTTSIPYGICDGTSTSTAYTATVPGITELRDGVCMWLKNGVVTSESGFTININNLGAKPVYTNLAASTRDTTVWNTAYTMFFVYDSTRVSGGCWVLYRGYDSNTNTIGYQIRTNSQSLPMKSIVYCYRLLFTSADGAHFVPANNSTSTNATSSRTVCTDKIDPFGQIFYYGTTASVAAGSRPSVSYLWEQYALTLGYSFNRTGAALVLTTYKPVYVKCAPQNDGSAIIDSTTPYVQSLPVTEDGMIYIYLGIAYSATQIELEINHPVYYYKNGQIRPWTNADIPTNVSSFTNDAGYLTLSTLPIWDGSVT